MFRNIYDPKAPPRRGSHFSRGISEYIFVFQYHSDKYPIDKEMVSVLTLLVLTLVCVVSLADDSVPASVDWRARGAVTAVKSTGNCSGGSSAFAAAGAVEGAYQIATGRLLELSAQQLLDCDSSYGNTGCSQGFPQNSFMYLDEATGLHTESDYPFTRASGTCKKKDGFVVGIDGYDNLYSSSDDTDIVKIVAKQPVTALLDSTTDAFKNYKGGIFKGPCADDRPNHAVLIVGYGSQNGEDFWILKNSWGTSWGESGYMRLQRGKHGLPLGRCGINSFVYYPQKSPSSSDNTDGLVGWWKLDDKSGSVAKDSSSSQAAGVIAGATWVTPGLSFQGSGRVFCGDRASLCGKTPFSVVAWVQVSSSYRAKGIIIQQRGPSNWSGKWTTDGYNGEYQLYLEGGKPSLWVYGDGADQFRFSGSVTVNDGRWHHIVAVRDGREGRLYVDGALAGSASGDVKNLVSNFPVYIGCDCRDNVDFFRGSLAGLRIYSRALSASEIKSLSSAGPNKVALHTVA